MIIHFLSFCVFYEPGWALGEHGEWAKYSNFDVTTHVPLMFYVPGRTAPLPKAGEKLFPYINPFDSISELMEPGIQYAEVILLESNRGHLTTSWPGDLPSPPSCPVLPFLHTCPGHLMPVKWTHKKWLGWQNVCCLHVTTIKGEIDQIQTPKKESSAD